MDTLFFIASKLFWLIARPEVVLAAILILGAVLLQMGRLVWGTRLATLGAFCILALSVLPVWRPLLGPLEQAYPPNPEIAEAPRGVIVLGGGEVPDVTTIWGQPGVNAAGERFIEAIALANRFPETKIFFTGGSGALRQYRSGSEIAELLFLGVGLPPERLIFERKSRNTAENAAFLLDMIGEREGPWLLVTSAFHMPRSVATFCAAGWTDLVPYPVDFRSGGKTTGLAFNLDLLNLSVKEWVGMLAYRITGRARWPENMPGCLADVPESEAMVVSSTE